MSSSNIKILLCNIALRDEYDPFPPVACTSLCNILIRNGYNPKFYDIDAKRPTFDELAAYFTKEQFDIVGISAVASTGYKYTKELSSLIKKFSPKTQIVLGGNMASSCAILLKKCPIDICVIGEGEKVILNLVRFFEVNGDLKTNKNGLQDIKSIAFLDSDGNCKITDNEEPLTGDEIAADYDLIEKYSDISKYLLDPLKRTDFAVDPRSHQPHRKGQKMAQIVTSKGCINICTFCHRWIKGYKMIPVDKVISYVKHLKQKYNVGFFVINVECFSENEKWLSEFIEKVKLLDVLFIVGGARVSIIKRNRDIIKQLKDAGMTALYFGMESGSEKILRVMEKNACVQDNIDAMTICKEAEVFTAIQLVVGMPGENEKTINETMEFVEKSTANLPYPPYLSVNFLQSLPGTPTYEFLRHNGLLGNGIDEEELYLIRVSDKNASYFGQYLNVSEETFSKVKNWPLRIMVRARINWLKNRKWVLEGVDDNFSQLVKDSFKRGLFLYKLIDLIDPVFWKLFQVRNLFQLYGAGEAILILTGIKAEENRNKYVIPAESLRKILSLDKFDNISHTKGTVSSES